MMLHTFILSLLFNFYTTVNPEVYVGKWEISSGSVISIYHKDTMFFGKVLKRSDFPLFNKNGLDYKLNVIYLHEVKSSHLVNIVNILHIENNLNDSSRLNVSQVPIAFR